MMKIFFGIREYDASTSSEDFGESAVSWRTRTTHDSYLKIIWFVGRDDTFKNETWQIQGNTMYNT